MRLSQESLKALPEELYGNAGCEVCLISFRLLLEHSGGSCKACKLMTMFAIFEVLRASGGGTIGPRRPFGRSLEPLELLEASWNALGGLLERSWRAPGSTKSALERLLAAPRGVSRQVSAI